MLLINPGNVFIKVVLPASYCPSRLLIPTDDTRFNARTTSDRNFCWTVASIPKLVFVTTWTAQVVRGFASVPIRNSLGVVPVKFVATVCQKFGPTPQTQQLPSMYLLLNYARWPQHCKPIYELNSKDALPARPIFYYLATDSVLNGRRGNVLPAHANWIVFDLLFTCKLIFFSRVFVLLPVLFIGCCIALCG